MADTVGVTKRPRPLYQSQFASSDEFADPSLSSSRGCSSPSDARPSMIVTLKTKSPAGKRKLEEIQRGSETRKKRLPPAQTIEENGYGRKRVCLIYESRAERHILLQPSPERIPFPPVSGPVGRQHPPPIGRDGTPFHPDIQTNVYLSTRPSRHHSKPQSSRRCNRCILHKKGCDGATPACGYCSKMKGANSCVYEDYHILAANQHEKTIDDPASKCRRFEEGLRTARSGVGGHVEEQYAKILQTRRLALESECSEWEPGQWSYAHYERMMKYIDQGIETPDDGGQFDETTLMFDRFQRQEGSIADEWTREQFAAVEVRWGDIFRYCGQHPFVWPHGAATADGFGSAETLRRNVGLPARISPPEG